MTTSAHCHDAEEPIRLRTFGLLAAVLLASCQAQPLQNIKDLKAVAVDSSASCAIHSSGQVVCWGSQSSLGIGPGLPQTTPVRIKGLANVTQLSLGMGQRCALRSQGDVYCGRDMGSLQAVPGVTDAIHISSSGSHACAVRKTGQVLCWGMNDWGQLGVGRPYDAKHPPTLVPNVDGVVQVAAYGQYTCALRETGEVLCWGGAHMHEMAMGRIHGIEDAVEISAGRSICARTRSGAVLCWRGPGNDTPEWTDIQPERIAGVDDVVQISAGYNYVCAVRKSGQVVCWGENAEGQLGDGTRQDRDQPVPVQGLTDAVQVAAKARHTCALRENGQVVCWGTYLMGVLGDGKKQDRLTPEL
jgi:alpha-tubulin suppressor-like RCC1 family protein